MLALSEAWPESLSCLEVWLEHIIHTRLQMRQNLHNIKTCRGNRACINTYSENIMLIGFRWVRHVYMRKRLVENDLVSSVGLFIFKRLLWMEPFIPSITAEKLFVHRATMWDSLNIAHVSARHLIEMQIWGVRDIKNMPVIHLSNRQDLDSEILRSH